MASSFPGAIDSFTNPLASSPLNSPSHAGQHQDLNDAVNKIETFMGLVKVTSGSLSGSTTNFANCFTSLYRNYRVVIDNIKGSAANDLYMRYLITGTTPQSANAYYWAYRGFATSGTGQDSSSGGNSRAYMGWTCSGAGGAGSVSFDISNPNVATQTTTVGVSAYLITGAYASRSGMTAWDGNDVFTGIQFITGDATTLTGNVTIYGYRN